MKNRLISLFLAAIATVFAAVIIFAMTEVRYSKIENHIANSARIITENNAKTAFPVTSTGIRCTRLWSQVMPTSLSTI